MTNNIYFEHINQLLTIKANASKQLDKARKMHNEANDIHWSLSDVEEKSERHNAYLKSNELYKKSNEISTLYTMVKNACDDAIMKCASNAIIEDFKNNTKKWIKTPIHYKKFDSMVNDFFIDFMKTYDNGNTSNFRITKDYYRISIHNYTLCDHNYNEVQLLYAGNNGEKLTTEDIEKMTFFDYVLPDAIVPTCKKAIKDAEKMKKLYADAYAKISAIKKEYNNSSAIYFNMPSMNAYMNK